MKKITMRNFDPSTLTPVRDFTGDEIRALREREGLSVTTFAYRLNVSEKLLGQWESGARVPRGPAAKLLTLIEQRGLGFLS